MDFITGASGIVAIIALFIVLPSKIISAFRQNAKRKREFELEKLKIQKQMLELEIEKEKNQILKLEAEGRKLDEIIYNS